MLEGSDPLVFSRPTRFSPELTLGLVLLAMLLLTAILLLASS